MEAATQNGTAVQESMQTAMSASGNPGMGKTAIVGVITAAALATSAIVYGVVKFFSRKKKKAAQDDADKTEPGTKD